MLERHGRSSFGPGAYVFPGGMLEPEDGSIQAQRVSKGISGKENAGRMPGTLRPESALGVHIAAIRETFEETLVLLAETQNGEPLPALFSHPEELRKAREAIDGDRGGFFQWLTDHHLVLPTEKLVYFAHWVTPEGLPIRFSTHFFACCAPEFAQVQPDDNEVVGYLWASPSVLLSRWECGELKLMDPTLRTLELLTGYTTVEMILQALRKRRVETIMPKLRIGEDGSKTIIYPWDGAYQHS